MVPFRTIPNRNIRHDVMYIIFLPYRTASKKINSDMMGVLASRTKASATTTLPLWWEIVTACGGREAGGGAEAARPDQGFRRLTIDLQVRQVVSYTRVHPE